METKELTVVVLIALVVTGCASRRVVPFRSPDLDQSQEENASSRFESAKKELKASARNLDGREIYREFNGYRIGADAIELETDEKIVFTGDVVLASKSTDVAQAPRAEADKKSGKVFLTGEAIRVLFGGRLVLPHSEDAVVILGPGFQHQLKGRNTVSFKIENRSPSGKR